jgi:ribokinase
MMPDRKPVVVVGSINMDLVARTPRIALAGETLTGTGFETTPGGKGANQAVAVARLSYPIAMVGMVGDDVFGEALLKNLTTEGVDVAAVARVSGPSGVAQIQVADHGENSIIVVAGANGKVDAHYIDAHASLIRSAGMVLCQLELPIATVLHTVGLCSEARVPVMLDPAPAAPLPASIWPHVTWFTPNETEAILYTGDRLAPEESAANLLRKGLKGVVLKRGSAGAYIASSESGTAWVPGFQVNAIDTVGAGDCFNGSFAVALLEDRSPKEAAQFASAAAAISVTRRGAQASMPTRVEVERFLADRGIA